MVSRVSQIDCPEFPNSQGKTRETSILILPEDIIFNILAWLPARVLYNVARCVCCQWLRIVEDPHFVSTHYSLSHNTLVMYYRKDSLYHILDLGGCCRAKLSGLKFSLPLRYSIRPCNGLMLISQYKSIKPTEWAYYVGNPITRRTLALPPLSLPIFPSFCGIAFEASSRVYKVVIIYNTVDKYMTEKHLFNPFSLDLGCAILTVGVDKAWRVLNCAHFTEEDFELFKLRPPITSTNFIYWVPYSKSSQLYMLVLDLKSESIKRISLPLVYEGKHRSKFLPERNSISVWYANSNFSMEVWLLKDYMTGEWVKVLYIDGNLIRNELCKVMSPEKFARSSNIQALIIPRSWLGNGEKILFQSAYEISHLLVYDLKTCRCCKLDLESAESFDSLVNPLLFVNSLAWVC